MADTVKQIGVKQQDGTYSMKDIEVDYSNVAGLSTQATSAKATADKNNKDITTYIASGSKNGENLVLTDGAGTTSNVDLSMTGATSNANGEAGFVPQPTSADVDKFLKADGTWDVPPGEEYIGSSNISINSSTNAIDLTNTTVSSGTYGPSADVVGNNGTTILVPNISVDAKGRVTNITNKTYTSVDTGSKVFTGSLQEWDQLTIAQKKTYDFISNEDPGGTQGTFPSDRVSYDNTISELTANDVQEAVDEVVARIGNSTNLPKSAGISYYTFPYSNSLNSKSQIQTYLQYANISKGIQVITFTLIKQPDVTTGIMVTQFAQSHPSNSNQGNGVGVFIGYYYNNSPIYFKCINGIYTLYDMFQDNRLKSNEKEFTNITLNANKEVNLGNIYTQMLPSGVNGTIMLVEICSASTGAGTLRIECGQYRLDSNMWLIGNVANQSIAKVNLRALYYEN